MITRICTLAALALALAFLARSSRADSTSPTLSGSLQLDYLAVPTNPQARQSTLDGATVELSLKMTHDFTKNVSASVKVCFACHGFEAAMAVVELRAADELRVRVGRFTPAFGSFPMRADPANHATSDKPLPYDMGRMVRRLDWNEGILPAPWVDNGVEVGGTHFWSGGQLDYAAYGISGPKAGPAATDFDFILSRSPSQYYVDNNSEPSIGARVALKLELGNDASVTGGASGMTGRYDPDRSLGFAIAGVDLVAQFGTTFVRGEYLLRATQMALGATPATTFKYGPGKDGTFSNYFMKEGFYLEAEVPVGGVAMIARWDGLRRLGNVLATSALSSYSSVYRYTLAMAVRVRAQIRIKTSVEYYQFSDFANDLAIHLGLATPF